MPVQLGDPILDDPGVITDYPATMGQAAYAAGRRAYDSGGFVYGAYNSIRGQLDYNFGERVSKEDALKRVGQLGLSIDVPEEGLSKYRLDTLIWYKAREMRDQVDLQRGPGGIAAGAANLGMGLLGSIGDPLAMAANFVPVVAQAKWANALRQAGTSKLARAGVRAKYGAVEGLAGAALIEPLMIAHNKYNQLDYTAMDSFLNIAMGAGTGAGLHMIGGYAFDKFSGASVPRLRALIDKMDESTQAKVLEEYVDAAVNGRTPKDAMKMFMEEFRSGYEGWSSKKASALTDVELAARGLERDPSMLRRAETEIMSYRNPEGPRDTGRHLLASIALDGGIKVRDANGDITREGGEILAILKDYKYPGLINNVHGSPPDYIRERLAEDGWFGDGRDLGEVGIEELYDALSRGTREPVNHPHFADADGFNKAQKRFMDNMARELEEAGVKAYDSPAEASAKLADHRAKVAQQRALEDIDFSPEEFLFRDPSEPLDEAEISARFGEEQGAEPYSFAEAEALRRQTARDAAQAEVDKARTTDEEEAIADDISRLDRVVNSLKKQDLWTEADEKLLQEAQSDRDLAAAFEAVYKAAAVCELQ